MPSRLPWFVAIGASGMAGLQDIQTVLAALAPDLDAVVLVVLHRPFDRHSHLRDVLARATALPVIIAGEGERFERGCCYIGELAEHLTVAARSFGQLVDDAGNLHRNRTVDLLFRSIAKHGGRRIIGVILSGALDDGSRGIVAIHAAGGRTMVIKPAATGQDGMPENAINYDGPVDCIGTRQQIAEAIQQMIDA